ncbi:tetratricopeptide repeat protein [Azospirillum doebereinerae]|uniref:Tetratricopeptide repeat protein n=1 Tax=Azospirillum doebereinerae TaxID=92933 RepID=A0A3S0UYC8_9PROT|nr:tetratricopeptide repeat protein [Azospirillum doebereinerae]RUQ64547.1 tetratricopeptide repeat protein [Azospirillum doebereinerae]
MRTNLLVVLLVLLFGGGASLLLIPRGGELALQKFRDNDYESARADYEKRFAAGDRGAATVIPLTKLNVAEGEVEGAIALMEDFVARAPKSIDGWELLSRLYQDAQRQGDYLESLRELARLRGSDDAYRELAYLAGFQGRLDVQTEALVRYCERRPDDAQAQQELAALLAAQGDHEGAVDWLVRADDRAKGNISPDSRELLMSLLTDLDREADAFQRAQRWLGETPSVTDMIGLASQLSAGGRPDLGLRLLEPQVAKPGRALALELTVIDLQLATGRTDDARARLTALKDPVDDVMLGRLLSLQMNAGLGRLALTTAQGHDLKLIPDWVLAGLAEAAFRDRDRAFLNRLVGELGEGFLEERPILAANIALGRGDAAAAVRWASRGLADAHQPLSERLAAVRILTLAGKRVDAVAGFDRLPLGNAIGDDSLDELASMFLDLDRAPAGLAWFETRRRSVPSLPADLGWVRLAAKAGDPAAVVAWLDAHPEPLGAALLQDIAGFASERGAGQLALKAAERVFAMAPTARSRFALASALLAAGRGVEALPHLTLLLAGGGTEIETAYVAALDAAGRTEELTRFLSAKLARGGLSDEEERAIVFTLLDRKAYGAALPVLRSLAERLGGEWLFGYADAARKVGALPDLIALLERQLADPALTAEGREQRATLLLEAAGPVRALPILKQLATASAGGPWDSLYRETLAKLGRKDELRRYLLARAADDRLAAKDRREVASALIELGDKAGAEQALRRLAAAQGPQGDDFKQLLFLWGPRPPAEALDWIEARAKAAGSPADQTAWYASLADLGGARRVTEKLGSTGTPDAPALKTPYIEALAAEGKGKELAEAVRSALATERAPDRLRRYARLAEQVRERKAAADAWTVLLAQKPDDSEALRQLGMLAYDENRLEDAERLLRRFVARGPNDYEAHYFLGEALTALKRPGAAFPFYTTALAQLRAGKTRNDATAQTEANLLNRLGKLDESVALFENLRKRRPNDRQLKADYASMLIENGRLQEARRVLSLQ